MPWLETICMLMSNDAHFYSHCPLISAAWCFLPISIFSHYLTLLYGDDRLQQLMVLVSLFVLLQYCFRLAKHLPCSGLCIRIFVVVPLCSLIKPYDLDHVSETNTHRNKIIRNNNKSIVLSVLSLTTFNHN